MEDTPQEIIEERHNSSRRDFLKKSAVTGAVVWSAPAISTLSSKAWAETAGYEPGCECDEGAYALKATATGLIAGTVGPIAESGDAPDEASVLNLDPGVLNGLVVARALASETTECRAHAEVAYVAIDLSVLGIELLGISLIEAEVLTADANGNTCEADSDILVIRADGNVVDVGTDPNSQASLNLGALGSVRIVVNEQTGGTDAIEVNALHVFVDVVGAQTLDLIVSHAETTCC